MHAAYANDNGVGELKLSTVLAFDLGAGSWRALIGELIAVDEEWLKLTVKEIHRFPKQAIHVGNHMHWDILRLLQEVKIGIRKAYQEGYRPDTLGIDTWGVDPDDSRFYTPHGMVEKIQSYCRETGQKVPAAEGEIIRCVLESLAFRYSYALEQLEKLTGRSFRGLHMVGGGIQNGLLCQLTANAIGRLVWAGPVEASAIGNMLVQLIASGHCRDLKEALLGEELVSGRSL